MHDKYLITLGQITGLGPATINRLLSHFGSYKNIWQATNADLKNIKASDLLIEKLTLAQQQLDPDKIIEEIQQHKIEVVVFTDDDYPFLLKQIKQPPLILYIRGNKSILNSQPAISIVGTRRHSFYGKKILEQFMSDWANYINVTISGLAYGIDTIAHQQSLKNNIYTVAVVASGLDWPSFQPQGQRWLAENIINNNGCVLTDFPIKSVVQKYNFPQRNRLIAGLSKVTVVIEADVKSGALITADWALDYGREVYALAGDVNRNQSRGCNQLIAKGANILTCPSDLLNVFKLSPKQTENEIEYQSISHDQQKIINCLKTESLINIDDLSYLTNLSNNQLTIELSNLELNNLVQRDLFGNYQLK